MLTTSGCCGWGASVSAVVEMPLAFGAVMTFANRKLVKQLQPSAGGGRLHHLRPDGAM